METIIFGECVYQINELVLVSYIYAVIYPIHMDKKVDGARVIAMVF